MAAGISIKVTGDKALARKFQRQIRKSKDTRSLNKLIGLKMLRVIDQQFRKEGREFGPAWKPLAKSTVALRPKGSSRILRKTGRLSQSITSQAGPLSVKVGTSLLYSPVHQKGDRARKISVRRAGILAARIPSGRKAAARATFGKGRVSGNFVIFGKSVNRGPIPKRPFLPEGAALRRVIRRDILPTVRSHVRKILK